MTMTEAIVLDGKLTWLEVAAVAEGAELTLSPAAWTRVDKGRQIVEALVDKQIRGYGINTGVGALCDVVIDRNDQQALSRHCSEPQLRRRPTLGQDRDARGHGRPDC
jgi:histidine ammonia-lyase